MRRIVLFIILWLSVNSLTLYGQTRTAVTATIQDTGGNLATSGYVQFTLSPSSSAVAYRVQGSGTIAPQNTRCTINGTGNIPSCLIWGNSVLSPANSQYTVTIAPANVVSETLNGVCINGTTYDLSSLTFCPSIRLTPEQTVVTTPPTQANIIPSAGHTFTVGSSQQTYASGYFDQIFATGINNVTNFNQTQLCSQSPGADAAAKINNCLKSLGSQGIADATGIIGSQSGSTDPFSGVSNASTLKLGPMTLTLSAAWNPPAGTVIMGSGRGQTIIQTSGNSTNAINVLSNSTVAHVSIVGTNVLTSGTGMGINSGSASNVTIEDVDISAMSNHCLNTGGSPTNWTITKNYIHGCGNDGLLISNGATSSSMVANIIYANGSNGIDLNGSGNLVAGNVVVGNGWRLAGSGVDNFGILVNGNGSAPATNADNNVITGNTVVANVGPGIFIRSDTPQHANGNIVSGNVCSNNSSTGVANGDGITIDTSSTGTESNNSVVGNTCLNNQRYGIQIGGGSGTATFNLISGNTASGNGTGNVGNSGTTSKIWGNNETTVDSNFYLDTGSIIVKANSPVLALGGNAAGAGAIRLYNNPSGGGIAYRNAANSADLLADVIDNNNNHIIRGGGGTNSFVLQTSTGLALLTCNESQFCTFNAQATFALGLDVANGSSLPSAANLVLGNAGNYFNVTGTTQINCVDNSRVGPIYLRFAGALTFKFNQSCTTGFQPILTPGSADITTSGNTVISLIRDTSSAVWQVTAVKQP